MQHTPSRKCNEYQAAYARARDVRADAIRRRRAEAVAQAVRAADALDRHILRRRLEALREKEPVR